jgi:rubredoxin-NAD+ reductase
MVTERELGVVIVGTGHAGYCVARALRSRAPRLALTLVSAEEGHVYGKPSLSVSISQRASKADLILRTGQQMREQLGCELLSGVRVTAIDRARRTIQMGEREYGFSDLVLALGATPQLPPVAGLSSSPRVLCLHDLESYGRLVELLTRSARVAILGAGFIGCELANDLNRAGHAVTLIDRTREPLAGLVPAAVGARLRRRLQEVGVYCRFGAEPSFVSPAERGHAIAVEIPGSPTVTADILVCATGQRPSDELARSAGLATERGVLIDRHLRTVDRHVYALGDCARLVAHNLQFIAPIAPAAAVLAECLLGGHVELSLPPLSISVKTPCFPVVGSAGARDDKIVWDVVEDGGGVTAIACDAGGALRAFALGGTHVSDRGQYLAALPPLL